jgi:hypothetical protein
MRIRRCFTCVAMLALMFGCCVAWSAAPFQILINHLGYDPKGAKRLVVQSAGNIELAQFRVLDSQGRVAFEGPLQKTGAVDGWKGRFFHQGDFSTLGQLGTYRIQVKEALSESFTVRQGLLPETCLADLIYYFRIQRCSGV